VARGFNRIYEKGAVQEAGCWAHVRRKLYDLQQAHASPVAAIRIQHCLYVPVAMSYMCSARIVRDDAQTGS
jgi:hypothetical protein